MGQDCIAPASQNGPSSAEPIRQAPRSLTTLMRSWGEDEGVSRACFRHVARLAVVVLEENVSAVSAVIPRNLLAVCPVASDNVHYYAQIS